MEFLSKKTFQPECHVTYMTFGEKSEILKTLLIATHPTWDVWINSTAYNGVWKSLFRTFLHGNLSYQIYPVVGWLRAEDQTILQLLNENCRN